MSLNSKGLASKRVRHAGRPTEGVTDGSDAGQGLIDAGGARELVGSSILCCSTRHAHLFGGVKRVSQTGGPGDGPWRVRGATGAITDTGRDGGGIGPVEGFQRRPPGVGGT